MKKLLYASLFAVLLFSCKKDSPPEKPASAPYQPSVSGVFIVNEGGFHYANASISYYDLAKGSVSNDIYATANGGAALGDVCQHMVIFNNLAYLVLNVSAKVEIVDTKTFKHVGSISNGFNSPRYFLPIDSTKAYVTDLYSNTISVVDLHSRTKTKDIPCRGWTEELLLYNNIAYVTAVRHSAIYLIDTHTDAVVDSVPLSLGPTSIVQDKNKKIWVLCSGDDSKSIAANLYRISPDTRKVEKKFTLPVGQTPAHLCINSSADTLYYLNNGVYQLPVTDDILPSFPLVAAGGRNFYGLEIEPGSGRIYTSDAKDYQQTSTIYRYQSNGQLINSFSAGLISNGFVFYKQ